MSNEKAQKALPPIALLIGGLLLVCAILLLILRHPSEENQSPAKQTTPSTTTAIPHALVIRHPRTPTSAEPESAEVVLHRKMTQFSQKERAIFEALAAKNHVAVPDEVKRFFDAVEAGNWDEARAIFKSLQDPGNPSGSHSEDIRPFWRPIQDTWGAVMMAQLMPAQQYLDYGNNILGALKPGMVYVGGTDPGMFIPNMLNATSDGDQHIVLTQNGLADGTYLNYLNHLYGDQLKTLTAEDSQRAFNDYTEDAKKRLLHDQQFPDEPKQIRPGEDIKMENGHVVMSGQVAVMSINERLLQTLLQKNPDLSFGLEESYPLKSTYSGATPLGPIMQLQGDSSTFSADIAAQTVKFWQTTAQQLLANPEAAGSADTLLTYSHDAVAQANLLAAHDFTAEAEQAYNLASQLAPASFEAVAGLSDILYRNGKPDQAIQILNDFAQKNPDQQKAVDQQRASLVAVPKK